MAKATGVCDFGPSAHSLDRSHLSKFMSEDLSGSTYKNPLLTFGATFANKFSGTFYTFKHFSTFCNKGTNHSIVLKENGYLTVI